MDHLRLSLSPICSAALRLAIVLLAIHGGLELTRTVLAQEDRQAFLPHVEQSGSLTDRVTELEYLLEHFSRDGDTIVISAANLQVVNGTGTTDGEPNTLGNVIVGYNEPRGDGTDNHGGSHMLVVGARNNFSRFGGIVVGDTNSATGDFASVSGGFANEASGAASSVSGGEYNVASGPVAAVGGGIGGKATGADSSVCGGQFNIAAGVVSAVSGGTGNRADGEGSSVSGGTGNVASGVHSSVSGGSDNRARGSSSCVTGGYNNYADGDVSSVSGGFYRVAEGQFNWAAGSLLEQQ